MTITFSPSPYIRSSYVVMDDTAILGSASKTEDRKWRAFAYLNPTFKEIGKYKTRREAVEEIKKFLKR